MQRIIEAWNAYRDWAGNLDSEGRFFILAGSVPLLRIYALIDFIPAQYGQSGAKVREGKEHQAG